MNYENFGIYRHRENLTLKEAAELIGVSIHSVYLWECGQVIPSRRNLKKICEAYHIKEEDLDR